MHKARFVIIGTTAALAVGVAATPALAAPTADTDVTFTVSGGTLDIAAPATATLATPGAPAATIRGSLGAVTVTDSRGATDGSWVTTVTSTDFVTGASSASETIGAALIDYWSGATTAPTGTGTFTPGQALTTNAAALDNADPLTAFTRAGGTGNSVCTWSPSLNIHVPLANVAGSYTGTVTHSVA